MKTLNKEVSNLKLNVSRINSYLINSNKIVRKIDSNKKSLNEKIIGERKRDIKEKKLESPISGISKITQKVSSAVLSGPLSFFDKIKEFFGILLIGLLVKNLPKIIETIEQFFNNNKWIFTGIGFLLDVIGKGLSGLFSLVDKVFSSDTESIKRDQKKIDSEFKTLNKELDDSQRDVDRELKNLGKQTEKEEKPERVEKTSISTQKSQKGPVEKESGQKPSMSSTSPKQEVEEPLPKYSKGGLVDQPKPESKKMTASKPSDFGDRSSVTSKRAIQTVNYFKFFNNNNKDGEEISETNKKNNEKFKESLKSLETIQEIKRLIGDDEPGDYGLPSVPSGALDQGVLEYEVSGGDLPSSYPGRGTASHGYPGRDYQISVGKAITVFKPGTVTYAALNPSGYGNLVIVKHSDGTQSYYAHLSKINVNVGDEIKENENKVIGLTGGEEGAPGAGNSRGPHLHFEIRDSNDRRITDYNSGDNYFRFGTVTGVKKKSQDEIDRLKSLKSPPAVTGVLDKTNKKLTLPEVVKLLRDSGASESEVEYLSAIAFKENADGSTGKVRDRPDTGDLSYGLWQINMIDDLGPARRKQFGLTSNDDLLDPRVNARAALILLRSSGKNTWRNSTKKLTTQDIKNVREEMDKNKQASLTPIETKVNIGEGSLSSGAHVAYLQTMIVNNTGYIPMIMPIGTRKQYPSSESTKRLNSFSSIA